MRIIAVSHSTNSTVLCCNNNQKQQQKSNTKIWPLILTGDLAHRYCIILHLVTNLPWARLGCITTINTIFPYALPFPTHLTKQLGQ